MTAATDAGNRDSTEWPQQASKRRMAVHLALVAHLTVAVAHGVTHALVPVWLTTTQNAVVLSTTFVGPVVGVALASRDHPAGIPLFTLSMLGALAVGGGLHFVVENPDHVSAIPAGPWRLPFRASALAVALTPALGTATGAWAWWHR
jgi:hypothetical protein